MRRGTWPLDLLRTGGEIRTLLAGIDARKLSLGRRPLQGRPVGVVLWSGVDGAIVVPIAPPQPAPRARAIEPVDDRAQVPAIAVLAGVG